MCGPFAVSIGMGSSNWIHNLRRQSIYTVGRLFTYCFGGVLASFAGIQIASRFANSGLIGIQSLLAIVAGVFLIFQGFNALGFRWQLSKQSLPIPCAARRVFQAMLTSRGLWSVFQAGLISGFLPCALVYANLALAAASGSLARGILIMATFGLGTSPLMMFVGIGASFLPIATRSRILKLAAICVMVTGSISIYRGMAYEGFTFSRQPGACPMCHPLKS